MSRSPANTPTGVVVQDLMKHAEKREDEIGRNGMSDAMRKAATMLIDLTTPKKAVTVKTHG